MRKTSVLISQRSTSGNMKEFTSKNAAMKFKIQFITDFIIIISTIQIMCT